MTQQPRAAAQQQLPDRQRETLHARLRPGDDGWRTPTIEDAEHPAHSRGLFETREVQSAEVGDGAVLARGRLRQGHAPTLKEHGRDSLDSIDDGKAKDLTWKQRIKHITWAWFTLTMATGGIANVLYHVPLRFPGLYAIGVIFLLVNVVCYIIIWGLLISRFVMYPSTFRASFTHPTESLFAPAFIVSFGTILITIVEYGASRVGDWLRDAVHVLFWIDCTIAVSLSVLIYLILWSTQSFTIGRMTPIWIFPAYPLLIVGPHAANLTSGALHLSSSQALRVLVAGFTIQGIGLLFSMTIYSAFVYRLMTQKLPAEPLRPGMFVSVGPAAFTVSGTMGMAENLSHIIRPDSLYMGIDGALAAAVLRLVGNWMCLWLWGLAWWFFFISLLSNAACLRQGHHTPFAMTWFSFIFPQTALITATFAVARAFDVQAIRIFGCVMTCLLIAAWALVVAYMVKAIVRKQIAWPEKGEDKSEGGFRPNVAAAATDEKKTVGGGSNNV